MADNSAPITFENASIYSPKAPEVGAVLGSLDKQKRLRREAALEYIRVGRDVFYTGAALNRFLTAQTRRSACSSGSEGCR